MLSSFLLVALGCSGSRPNAVLLPEADDLPPDTGSTEPPWYELDADRDGWSPIAGDCDDEDAAISPDAEDVPGDGIDSDCDGTDRPTRRPDLSWDGVERGQQLGYALAFGADLDHDGQPELTVAAPAVFADPYSGRTLGTVYQADDLGEMSSLTSITSWSGSQPYEYFGFDLAAGGDTNGDGFPELLIGSLFGPEHSAGVYVVRDTRSTVFAAYLHPAQISWLVLDSTFAQLDDDPLSEVLVLAADPNARTSHVVVVNPPQNNGTASLGWFDTAIFDDPNGQPQSVVAGDFDGDGTTDVLVASDQYTSALPPGRGVVHGCTAFRPTGIVEGADACSSSWAGETVGSTAGFAMAAGGDLDGDGHEDVLIGAPYADDRRGRAYLLTDPLRPGSFDLQDSYAQLSGEVEEDRLGAGLHLPGDLDGDGHDDALLAASADDEVSLPGRVYLFLGPCSSGALEPDDAAEVLAGTYAGGRFGWAMVSGDLDHDGLKELFVGAPDGDLDRGTVHLFTLP
ncbi:MAG: FG-GAP-like repeat-containing protein [Myxococcota bacterium]